LFCFIVDSGRSPGKTGFCFFKLSLIVDTTHKGCLAEYRFALECLKRGFAVSMPLLASSVYDCLIEKNGVIKKIQVKSAMSKEVDNKGVHVKIRRNDKQYPATLVDYFAVWVEDYKGFFIFKNDEKIKVKRLNLSGVNKIYFNNFAFR